MSTWPTKMVRCEHCSAEWQPEYAGKKIIRHVGGYRCVNRVRCHHRLMVASRLANLRPIRCDAYHPKP